MIKYIYHQHNYKFVIQVWKNISEGNIAVVDRVEKGEFVFVISYPSIDFAQVITKNGIIGYIRNFYLE